MALSIEQILTCFSLQNNKENAHQIRFYLSPLEAHSVIKIVTKPWIKGDKLNVKNTWCYLTGELIYVANYKFQLTDKAYRVKMDSTKVYLRVCLLIKRRTSDCCAGAFYSPKARDFQTRLCVYKKFC